jgi:hypothetical protein
VGGQLHALAALLEVAGLFALAKRKLTDPAGNGAPMHTTRTREQSDVAKSEGTLFENL